MHNRMLHNNVYLLLGTGGCPPDHAERGDTKPWGGIKMNWIAIEKLCLCDDKNYVVLPLMICDEVRKLKGIE